MSKTPVLTKKQQKLSLSGKKTKTKEIIRNILVSPFSKYWPLVSNGHYQALKRILSEYLPKLLPDKVKIPWTELKKVPKTERKKFREQYTAKYLGPGYLKENVEDRNGIVLGINAITKALETAKATSVLISEDVLPRLMVEHVIDQAVLLKVPVLVIPGLRNILKEKCGISSIAIAFTECSRYKVVQDYITDVSRNYPIPDNHINFNRASKLTDDSIIVIEDSIIENISKTNLTDITNTNIDTPTKEIKEGNLNEEKLTDYSGIINEDSIIENISKTNLTDITSTNTYKTVGDTKMKSLDDDCELKNTERVENVYLFRTTEDKRVFNPEKGSEEPKRRDTMDVDSSGFLSFSDDTPKQKISKKYFSLKVKKVKGDTNRTKRKIQASKERSKQTGAVKKVKKDIKKK